MSDPKSSIGCDLGYVRFLNTIATQGGSGWQGSCRVAEDLLDGSKSAITFGAGFSSAFQDGKLLPVGDSSVAGTAVPTQSWSVLGGISQDQFGYFTKDDDGLKKYTSRWIKRNMSNFGLGQTSVADQSWNIFKVQSATRYEIDPNLGSEFFSLKGYSVQLGAALLTESIYAINKPADQQTLRDGSRNIGLSFSIGLGKKNITFDSLNNVAKQDSFFPIFTYVSSDIFRLVASGIDYTNDSDISRAKRAQEDALGAPEPTFTPSAASNQSLLLLVGSFSGGMTNAAQRQQFSKLSNDSQTGLLWYHAARVAVAGIAYAAADEKDVASPLFFSSARSIVDMLVINKTTATEALAWHLGTSAAMIAAGTLSDNPGVSKAGMEGLSTTVWEPNPTENPELKGKTQVSAFFNSHYSRNIGDKKPEGTRGSVRVQNHLGDGYIYTATTLSSPQFSQDKNTALPASNDASAGIHVSTGDSTSVVRIRGNAGIGARMENSEVGTDFGALAEVGAALSIQPSSWSIDLGVRCAATKFGNGFDTECGFGIGLTR